MECPRCGGTVSAYRLGEDEARSCDSCGYVGVPVDHGSEPPPRESWTEALERFRELASGGGGGVEAPPETDRDEGTAVGADAAVIDAALAAADIPGSGATLDRRRAVVLELYEYLRERGRAARSDLLERIDPDEVGYASADAFWTNAGREGLRALPGARPPEADGGEWRFVDAKQDVVHIEE